MWYQRIILLNKQGGSFLTVSSLFETEKKNGRKQQGNWLPLLLASSTQVNHATRQLNCF